MFIISCFIVLGIAISSGATGCELKEKFSVSLGTSATGQSIGVESAEIDLKRKAILLSTRRDNQIIRISSNNGKILDQPYIDDIPGPRGSAVIGDLFYVTAGPEVRVYDLDDKTNPNAPELIASFDPSDIIGPDISNNFNGLCATNDGQTIYVSNPGFDFSTGTSTGTGAVYKIDLTQANADYSNVDQFAQVVTPFFFGTPIQPNGCVVDNNDRLLQGARFNPTTNTVQSDIYVYDDNDGSSALIPFVGLSTRIDGLVVTKDDALFLAEFISGTTNPTVYQVNDIDVLLDCLLDANCNQGSISLNVLDVTSVILEPADMGYDPQRNRLLVPSMKLTGGDTTTNFASFSIKGCKK